MADLCASSGSVIPEDGRVVCVCGRHWVNGEQVPLHTIEGHRRTHEKVARELDRYFDAWNRRNELRKVKVIKPYDVLQKGLQWGREVRVG